ncbi:MAG: TIM barrel protein [Oscillospiraceae bacterium]|nr:TIM barrel protein [Oscillospiraceae bacterium]
MEARFGPAGNSEKFQGKTTDIPEYLSSMGLTAYEYQCGRGVRINVEAVTKMGIDAKEKDIKLSVHAPYYISLSSTEEEKRNASIDYILQTAEAAKVMGADRVIVHSGSCSKISRKEALLYAGDTIAKAVKAMDEHGYGEISVCPETMGKINQLGTLEEVVELCKIDERLIPCVDFGHLNARTFGGLKEYSDFEYIFDYIEKNLGSQRMKNFHSHFSKIEYTSLGGEKRHLTFEDDVYGPVFDHIAEITAKKKCNIRFICESAGTQDIDAVTMKEIYMRYR